MDKEASSAATVIKSLQSISRGSSVDWAQLDVFVREKASLPYKNWRDTIAWSAELEGVIGDPEREDFRFTFDRVLTGGNWWGAAEHVAKVGGRRPWIVLVSGLNGIRKTTALYQPWFQEVLREALGDQIQSEGCDTEDLPVGGNSFFRQLDFMVATVASEEFRELYAQDVSVGEYSARKDGIFKRHRTVAEILGVLLLRAAAKGRMNMLIETSGRDVASFDFIDELFASEPLYRKLVVHFTIDELGHAERSVDLRMEAERRAGREIAASAEQLGDALSRARAVVNVNAGGPYGSEVLKAVKADSDAVLASVLGESGGGRQGWLKASVHIHGAADPSAWTARAVLRDGSQSPNIFTFRR